MDKQTKKRIDLAFILITLLNILWYGLYKNTKLTVIIMGTLMIASPFIWLIYRLVSGD